MPHINTPPNSESLAARLPPGIYYQLVHTFCEALPAPLSDSAEHLALRNEAAISHVAALQPANIAEAELAALHVIALQQVKSAVRLAEDPAMPLPSVIKCRAQAHSMMRQAQGALRALERMQALRQKTLANEEARDYAATIRCHALDQMQQALNALPPPPRPRRSRQEPEPTTDDTTDADASPTEPALTRLLDQLDHAPEELAHAAITAGLAVLTPQSEAPPPQNCPAGEPAEDTDSHQLVPFPENQRPAHTHRRSRDWPRPEHPQYQNGSLVATGVGCEALRCPTGASQPSPRTHGAWPTG